MKKRVLVYICLVLSCCLSFAKSDKTIKEFNKNTLTVASSFSQDDANMNETVSLKNNTDSTKIKEDILPVVIAIIVIVACLILFFLFHGYIPYRMAKNRGRNTVLWILLSFFISSILVIIILAIIGDSDTKRYEKIEDILKRNQGE